MLLINPAKEIEAGEYTIYIKYHAKLSKGLEGFYLSSYKTTAGQTRYVVDFVFKLII